MHMILIYPGGRNVDALLLSATEDLLRVVTRGRGDAVATSPAPGVQEPLRCSFCPSSESESWRFAGEHRDSVVREASARR